MFSLLNCLKNMPYNFRMFLSLHAVHKELNIDLLYWHQLIGGVLRPAGQKWASQVPFSDVVDGRETVETGG